VSARLPTLPCSLLPITYLLFLEIHSSIPPETEILLTHGPPRGILDTIYSGENVGCEELITRLRGIRPRLHVFGHIHEAHGAYIHTWNEATDGPLDEGACGASETIFINAASQPSGRLAQEALNDGMYMFSLLQRESWR
jgi:hypothetical protein